jgi:hypothetical protein
VFDSSLKKKKKKPAQKAEEVEEISEKKESEEEDSYDTPPMEGHVGYNYTYEEVSLRYDKLYYDTYNYMRTYAAPITSYMTHIPT